jgi:hypothetical protein
VARGMGLLWPSVSLGSFWSDIPVNLSFCSLSALF